MKPLNSLLIFFLLVFVQLGYAQIKVYNFEEFQPLTQQQNDTTYVINFWATWCIPCVKELPAFDQLNREYQGKKFKMILVSMDFGKDVVKRVDAYRKKKNLSPEVVILDDPDSNSWIPKIDKDWSGAIPATIIYRGNKWAFYDHDFTYDELLTEVKKFIQ